MLKFHEFCLLDEAVKSELVLNYGALIGERLNEGLKVYLYQVNAFYIEIWHRPDETSTTILKSFDNTHSLKPYLDQISLDDLPI
ncbi:hypothetical protein EXU57_18900 [Segetibacter sp. 3557_3]|uniref:hypothetical protein n=1 Tax=Segetibacter sp. 3557_3 TaxID=2547429 RepID=UPI001058E208|nr:hypothetical protein [Segetibacter sp. 3557_3]TDH21578.1 hypothetical protein EXU57_18900 [Segetibacter sp. 3557_3]